jgi:signal transduction histidine kinase
MGVPVLLGGQVWGLAVAAMFSPRAFPVEPLGLRFAVDGDNVAARILRSGRPERIDDYASVRGTSPAEILGVHAAVGVPITISGRLWGMIGAVSADAPMPAGTERRLSRFAEIASAAISSAQTRDDFQQLADEQAALLRVAQLVARGTAEAELFDVVAIEASGLIGGEGANLVRFDGPRTFTIIATCGGPTPVGLKVEIAEDDEGTAREVIRTHRPARRDNYRTSAAPLFSDGSYGLGSSVSVPIIVEGQLWGLLGCVTEGRRLPTGTERRLQQFAELVAAAIANAQLVTAAIANSQARAEMQHLAADQAAFRRVAELVARDAPVGQVFAEVATETSRVLGGMAAALLRFDPDGFAVVVATHDSPAALGLRIPIDSHSDVGGLFRSGRPFRIDSFERSDLAEVAREIGVTSGVAAPIIVEGGVWGALTTSASGPAPPSNCEEQLEQFAALAAVAITNVGNKAKLTASRARVVATADETRRRLQRDVHDGAQQRLVQTVITLKLGRDAAAKGKPTADLINEALRHAERANAELRELVHGILPASLSRSGLRSGLESLIADITTPVALEFSAPRLSAGTETTAYFIVAEALANVVKHAAASQARVRVNINALSLIIEVSDDGVGGADATRGSGLTGLQDRVDAAGGTLTIASELGGGTTLRASLPVDATPS